MSRTYPRHWRDHMVSVATVLVTIGALTVMGMRYAGAPQLGTKEASDRVRRVENGGRFAAVGPRLGSDSASVVIVEFSDFTCPACKLTAERLRAVRDRFPGQVAVIYRHFPIGEPGREAAIAAECARGAGRFEPMHDALFRGADSIGVRSLWSFAREAGVRDSAAFAGCLDSPSAQEAVWRDVNTADSLLIDTTPTFLVGDMLMVGAPDVEGLSTHIRRVLAARRAP